MRTAFIRALEEVAAEDKRIMLIVGDLGFGVVEPFAERFPERYVNSGVAEQNMTGMATGMALSGNIVFTYSIANFPTLRCLEQIRNDVCYHKAEVKIVSVGGGFSYGSLGMSHHLTEDIGIMRTLPNMTVIAPGDPIEAEAATRAVANWPGPCYLRLGRAGEPLVHKTPIDFRIGKAITVQDGKDVTLVSTGSMLDTTMSVATRLLERGIRARVLSMHTIKPLDVEAVLTAARETRGVVTIEEHSIIGGLGSAVAEILAETNTGNVLLTRMGLEPIFATEAGDQNYLRQAFGLSPDSIFERVVRMLETTGKFQEPN